MAVLKLKPAMKSYLWGGRNLIDHYGKECDDAILAETWELSCHKDGESVISEGVFSGMTLSRYIEKEGKDVLGANCKVFTDFPILVKLIDAEKSLSIQVHPSDEYGLRVEGQYGKTEMWYVLSAREGAYLYHGFRGEVSREEIKERIENHTITEVLNKVDVKAGDVFFIPAGTIHAICEGITIAEIQQNSNLTYRVYDYGRKGPDGKERQLHVDKALEVVDVKPQKESEEEGDSGKCLASCAYFHVEKEELLRPVEKFAGADSFHHLLFVEGEGTVSSGEESVSYKKGDSLFVSAGTGAYRIEGTGTVLVSTVP